MAFLFGKEWLLLGFTRVVSGFGVVLLGFTGFYWVSLSYTLCRFYTTIKGFTGFSLVLLSVRGPCVGFV